MNNSKISIYSCERSRGTIQSGKHYAGQEVFSGFLDLFTVIQEKHITSLNMQVLLILL